MELEKAEKSVCKIIFSPFSLIFSISNIFKDIENKNLNFIYVNSKTVLCKTQCFNLKVKGTTFSYALFSLCQPTTAVVVIEAVEATEAVVGEAVVVAILVKHALVTLLQVKGPQLALKIPHLPPH